jgi:hypothetical protein
VDAATALVSSAAPYSQSRGRGSRYGQGLSFDRDSFPRAPCHLTRSSRPRPDRPAAPGSSSTYGRPARLGAGRAKSHTCDFGPLPLGVSRAVFFTTLPPPPFGFPVWRHCHVNIQVDPRLKPILNILVDPPVKLVVVLSALAIVATLEHLNWSAYHLRNRCAQLYGSMHYAVEAKVNADARQRYKNLGCAYLQSQMNGSP